MSKQNNKQLNIGLFGFGVVGEALYRVLEQTPSLNAQIKKVCIRHAEKKRNAPAELFTTHAAELLNDESINVIVELIDDAEAAYHIVTTAIKGGKAVVSANKKLVADHLQELVALQEQYNTPLLYEAACCASIPVIRNLEEYYDNDLLQGISGIVNGSTNYILTRVFKEGISFQEALLQAQYEGFAESDPTLDINGTDAANKLAILLAHAYGIVTEPQRIVYNGIQNLNADDAIYAREKGYEIKLVAQARKLEDGSIAAFVLPQFVNRNNKLHTVSNEYNGILLSSGLAEEQFFYGKGAGGYATASAVLSDISTLRYGYKYEYRKLNSVQKFKPAKDFLLRVYARFEGLFQVPNEQFERIEEWSSNGTRCYITGIIRYSELQRSNWWKAQNVSLILLPDAISEKLERHEHTPEQQEALAV